VKVGLHILCGGFRPTLPPSRLGYLIFHSLKDDQDLDADITQSKLLKMGHPEETTASVVDHSVDFINGLSSHLEVHYDIKVAKLVSLDTNVFRLDQAAHSSWIARVFPSDSSPSFTEAESSAKILSFLRQYDFPAEKCAHEKPVSTFRGHEVLVTEFLDGGRPKVCAETFRRLGDLLGQLHTLPVDGGALNWKGGAWHHLRSRGGPHEEIAAALALLCQAKPRTPLQEHAAYEELRTELERVDDFTDLPESLVHPDFVPVNVIELPDGALVPIDWAGSGQGPRIFSLGWLLFAAGCNGIGMVDAVIAGYRSHISMSLGELSHLPNSIVTRQLTIACWEACNGRREIFDVVQKLPMMHRLAKEIGRRATAAFAEKELKTQAEKSDNIVSNSNVQLQEVGTTGLFTAAVRAEESKRPNRLFEDLLAQAFVSYWKYVPPSRQNSQRAEALRKFIIARTVFFDELILSASRSGCWQVVLLGAGMDTRAFRLPLPLDMCLFELDTADVLDSKSQVLKGHPASPVCSRILVSCDLRSDWSIKLLAAGFHPEKPTAWIVEGVLVYLDEGTVNDVIKAITAMSAPGSRMGLDMASHDQSESSAWRLRRSTAPFDPVIWLTEHGWTAVVSYARDVLRAHGRVPRESGPGKAEQTYKPKAILIDATTKL
jgi:methyltransferase (TIGR00027 family)